MIELTLSGTYKNQAGTKGEVFDYMDLKVKMPVCDEELHLFNVQRLTGLAITASEDYKNRCETVRETFVDGFKDIDEANPIIGKDIKGFDWVYLQYLAISKGINKIPLTRNTSLREAREIAYKEYSKSCLHIPVDDSILFNDLPELIVVDNGVKKEAVKQLDGDDAYDIDFNQKVSPTGKPSLDELKAIADKHNVQYSSKIGYDKLEKRLSDYGHM